MPDTFATAPDSRVPDIVILGSGFGGYTAARTLEQILAPGEAAIHLVSENNYHLFTPMLAEVAGGSVDPWHIAVPVRKALPRTDFVHGRVDAIDLERREVTYLPKLDEPAERLAFDQLIVALGSEPDFHQTPGVAEHGMPFRLLADASRLRNHVIALLEEADAESDHSTRSALTTFVVIGGGYSGVEAITHLRDLARDLIRDYEDIDPGMLRFVLVHSHERLVPQIGDRLADYVQRKLQREGIDLVLGEHVVEVDARSVTLESGQVIPTHTPVWTAGLRPNQAVERLPIELSGVGAIVVDATLAVPGVPGMWAIGDCAQVPDVTGAGDHSPLTAQHAHHQGKQAAYNVVACLRGRDPAPFRYRSPGMLVPLGRRDAVAEIYGFTFSGFLAWFVWRTVYWTLLPGLSKKFRVAMDWTADLLFGREVVLTRDPLELGSRKHRGRQAGIERTAAPPVDSNRDGA